MKFDAVVIGGGMAGMSRAMEICRAGLSCCVFSAGKSLDEIDYGEFISAGGTLMIGDRIVSGYIENCKVLYVNSNKLGETPIEADKFILATGRFFSGGLVADMDSIYEPVFGFDVEYELDRNKWFDMDFFKDQLFMKFGVKIDEKGHPLLDGLPVTNVEVVGDILSKM